MPINIITGAPGSGKTLWTLQEVEKVRQKEGRPVYYYKIPELTLPWEELPDPHKWQDLPNGSIIVADEAWGPFPNRPPGSPRPPYVAAFAEHRHRGFDFYLMMQSTSQLDQFIREMVGRHIHLERKFGMPRSRLWSWEARLGKPGDYMSRTEATASEFIFPAKFYGAYKSADMHTVKQRLPWMRLAAIGAAVVLAIALFVTVIGRFGHKKTEVSGASGQVAAVPGVSTARTAGDFDKAFAEVAPGEPFSPTFYRARLAPATLPRIAGFMVLQQGSQVVCSALTQQGTLIASMPQSRCLYLWRNGWFDFSRDSQREEEAEAQRLAALPRGSLADAQRAAVGGESSSGGAASGVPAPAPGAAGPAAGLALPDSVK